MLTCAGPSERFRKAFIGFTCRVKENPHKFNILVHVCLGGAKSIVVQKEQILILDFNPTEPCKL